MITTIQFTDNYQMESVYEILKDAIYQPTREKVDCRVIDWRNNGCTFYVSYINNQIVGILVVEKSENALIIKSIGEYRDWETGRGVFFSGEVN